MKRILCSILATALIISAFAACSKEKEVTPPAESSIEESVNSASEEDSAPAESSEEPSSTSEESKGEVVTAIPGSATTPVDLSAIKLPEGTTVFEKSDWNDLGNFKARVVGVVDAKSSMDRIPEGFPEDNQIFALIWEIETVKIPEWDEVLSISSYDFGFGGPSVTELTENLKDGGDVKSSVYSKEVGEVNYIFTMMTAKKLEDVKQSWYTYMVKNEEKDLYEHFYEYVYTMPFEGLLVNERPADFDYNIPLSAKVFDGAWSETTKSDTPMRGRLIAIDEYFISPDQLPDFMRDDEKLYVVYFEVENMGEEDVRFKSPTNISFSGSGVKDGIMSWCLYECTSYSSSSFSHPMPKGATDVVYKMFAAPSADSVEKILLDKYDDETVEVAFDFKGV